MKALKLVAKKILPWETRVKIKHEIKCCFYFGIKFKCPICGRQFRRMFPYGLIQRQNAACPNCYSLERHCLMWLYLKNKTNFFTNQLKVLHFAPERIFSKIFKSMENLEYTGADISSKLAMEKMDITNILKPNNTYDVILCSHVLEHIIDDRKAMSELYRILKPGGWAILQVPIPVDKTFEDESVVLWEDRERVFGQGDHVRKYGKDYKDRLEQVGFRVKVDDYVKRLGEKKIKKYSLTPSENIYFCMK